jgi:hypothetical protein
MLDETIIVFAFVALTFAAGLLHEGMWYFCAFVSMYAIVPLTVDFPAPSMIPFIALIFGILVLVMSIARTAMGRNRRGR